MSVEWEMLRDRHPATRLVDYVNDKPGTMTVLVTHGRTGLRRIVLEASPSA